eukprot:TRINITY_DN737_c0_g1_i1.p1 TRINITY_DN737_c0_g1~~TRINITY_DN737_c0_g1_i1.p1  ORF type:complete len:196 (-),score=0.67 TRINITY_DN737_c0_g1_i1:189-707(-)
MSSRFNYDAVSGEPGWADADAPESEKDDLLDKKWNKSALWSFKEDVETRSFMDWLEAGHNLSLPLHHYEGSIDFDGHRLVIDGHHKKDKAKTMRLTLLASQIQDVHYGFDETFRRREDRGLGLGFQPLRITYTSKVDGQTAVRVLLSSTFDSMRCVAVKPWVPQLTSTELVL